MNTIFTSLPVGILGGFDQDLKADTLLQYPALYGIGIRREAISWPKFLIHSLEAIYHACAVYYITIYSLSESLMLPTGQMLDRTSFSVISILYILWIANISVLMSTNTLNKISIGGVVLSNIFTIVYAFILSATPSFKNLIIYIFQMPSFWLTFVLAAIVCWIPRFAVGYLLRTLTPTDTQLAQEMESLVKKSGKTYAAVFPEADILIESRHSDPTRAGMGGPTLSAHSLRAQSVHFSQGRSSAVHKSTLEITDARTGARESFNLPDETEYLVKRNSEVGPPSLPPAPKERARSFANVRIDN